MVDAAMALAANGRRVTIADVAEAAQGINRYGLPLGLKPERSHP
jgi:hypothetical protein